MSFKIGEKVVALTSNVNSSQQPRKKGEIYTVLDFIICRCGCQKIRITTIQSNKLSAELNCSKCGQELYVGKNFFTNSDLFRPLDYQFAENLLAEITDLAKQDELVNV